MLIQTKPGDYFFNVVCYNTARDRVEFTHLKHISYYLSTYVPAKFLGVTIAHLKDGIHYE